MTDMTYERVSPDAATRRTTEGAATCRATSPDAGTVSSKQPKGFWRRFFDRMIEARLRRAEEQLRRWHSW